MRSDIIGKTKDGKSVHTCPKTEEHLKAHPDVSREIIAEAISKITLDNQQFLIEAIDLKREIGTSSCVSTTDADEIVFARRIGRKGDTRFVKNRTPEPTSKIVVGICIDRETGLPTLFTAFYGDLGAKEIWDAQYKVDKYGTPEDLAELKKAKEFWSSHALIYDESILEKEE